MVFVPIISYVGSNGSVVSYLTSVLDLFHQLKTNQNGNAKHQLQATSLLHRLATNHPHINCLSFSCWYGL